MRDTGMTDRHSTKVRATLQQGKAKNMALFCCKTLAASLIFVSALYAQEAPNGQRLYQTHCAVCHELPLTAPYMNRHVLKTIGPEGILNALHRGSMRSQGAKLSQEERAAVAEFLTGKKPGQFPPAEANVCAN